MGLNSRDLKQSQFRFIALLVAALMFTALIPLSIALVGDRGGRHAVVADISPILPVTKDDLVCSVHGLGLGGSDGSATCLYAWYKNDVLQAELKGDTVGAGYTAKGETWKCVVTANDGTSTSISQAEVVIRNSSPTAPIADVTPDLPRVADNLVCSITTPSSDADGDAVAYTYSWFKGGELQPQLTGDAVDATNNARGQTWRCLVTASDGAGGSAGSFDGVTIDSGNSAPSVPTIDLLPCQPICADDLVCSIVVLSMDPDRDTVTYSYSWYKDGVLQPGLSDDTVDSTCLEKGETWTCVVTASDGLGGNAGQFCQSTIQNSPPSAPAVDVTPDVPTATDSLVCSITVLSSDADGDTIAYTYAWYKGGVLQTGLTGSTVDASYVGDRATWKCVVTASDGAAGSAVGYDEVDTPGVAKNPGTVNCLLSYSESYRYLADATDRAHLIKACQDFGINTLEAQIDSWTIAKINAEPSNVATGIAALNAAGIQVWADWNGNSSGWDDVVEDHTWHEFCDVVLKWNKDHPTTKFTALEFDLEPPSDSTQDQHKAFLDGVYASMQTMRAHTVDGTETITSQRLPVVMFMDDRWGGTTCAGAWANVASQLDVVEIECYRWGGPDHPEGIGYSVYRAQDGLAIAIGQGCYFTALLSCDELPKTIDAENHYYSRFDLGRAAYEQAMQDYATYYDSLYPGKRVGCSSYFDVGGFMYWFNIDSVTSSPSGTYGADDTLTVSYQTRRRMDRNAHRVFGIQMELRDSAGTVWKVNQIIDLVDGQTTDRTISLTVPSGLASGAASVRITLWMVGWYDLKHYDMLYYGDYSGHESELLALTMDQLAATTTGPNGALTGKRTTFFMLQATDWQSGVTLTGG